MALPVKRSVAITLLVLFAVGGYLALHRWILKDPLPEGLIQANGRIEGDHMTVASKFPGRIQKLLVREGDAVIAGQILVQLDDTQTRARVAQARAAVAALQAEVKAAWTALGVLRKEVPLAIEMAEVNVIHAQF